MSKAIPIIRSIAARYKDRLPLYTASEFAHVRVEACDGCKTYIKSVDLTRDCHVVPVVDELATVALNVWAQSRRYNKLESTSWTLGFAANKGLKLTSKLRVSSSIETAIMSQLGAVGPDSETVTSA